MIFQPSGNLRKIRVKRPWGVLPFDKVKCQAPRTKACFGAEDFNTQVGEIELAHFVAGTGVGGAIAVEGGLPSASFFCVGKEREVGRIPVSGHEGVEIVTVPGVLLDEEDVLDGGAGVGDGGRERE